MNKTAVVYDKWLRSFGGGEIVACTIARILADEGYKVTLIGGKKVLAPLIYKKFEIDLEGVDIAEVWNDEIKLKSITKDKDLFVNVSYMDYSFGYSKRNMYYTHFPTESYGNVGELLFNRILMPLLARVIKPSEFITQIEAPVIINRRPAYLLKKNNRVAFFYLKAGEEYELEFNLYIESFYKGLFEGFHWVLENGEILDQKFSINHNYNEMYFKFKIKANLSTVYFNFNYTATSFSDDDRIFLMHPKFLIKGAHQSIFKKVEERINNRLRAGIFVNVLERLKSYQLILSNSFYTKLWIKNYWKRNAEVLYPPTEMLFKKYDLSKIKKEKIICSVGRFFTLGHGKKQEILVQAFKKIVDMGYTNWQLHLIGGVGDEISSLKFVKKLKRDAAGYPIYFHFNASRSKVEEIYLKSSIYWHAAGFGENERDYPDRFEHFGISPVEAISAGCIPVLFRGGGLTEIIDYIDLNSEDYTFSTINELVENTIQNMKNNSEDINWKKVFGLLDENFSSEAFKLKFIDLLAKLSV